MSPIRRVVEADVPWLLDISMRRYPGLLDPDFVRPWVTELAKSDAPILFIRTPDAYLLADLVFSTELPGRKDVHLIYLASDSPRGFQAYRLLKAMVQWSKMVGAQAVHFGSSTDVDLGPFAKRLGAKQEAPSFCLDIPS